LKALLVALGEPTDAEGSPTNLKKHIDSLSKLIVGFSTFADGRDTARYLALMPSLSSYFDWKVSHRYWEEAALPISSVTKWKTASSEVNQMLDEARADGVMF
jgi:hypothetical protein